MGVVEKSEDFQNMLTTIECVLECAAFGNIHVVQHLDAYLDLVG